MTWKKNSAGPHRWMVPDRFSAFAPNGNEVVPLINVLPNYRFERADDLLGKLAAGFAVAEGGAVVRDSRQNMCIVSIPGSRQINRQDYAAGGAGQFRRR